MQASQHASSLAFWICIGAGMAVALWAGAASIWIAVRDSAKDKQD